MKMTTSFTAMLVPVVLLLYTVSITTAQTSGQEQQATSILDATGIKGGLVVHVGCGEGKLTAALRVSDSYIIHGLDRDTTNIERARNHIQSLKLYGKVSIDQLKGRHLPYIDNLVNLVVSQVPDYVIMDEVMRVLCPGGVAYINSDGKWNKTIKVRPENIDDWTHYFHDATGNPVAHDTMVAPPRRSQWIGSPRWSRHHDHMASMSALVSASGRLFYIMDDGPRASIQLPANWQLVARDAFNGTILWKRPIASWNTHKWPLKSGPAQLTRRLVAVGDKVYVTLGLDAPLTALDPTTGSTIYTYKGTANTEEFVVSDGVVFLLANDAPSKWPQYQQKFPHVVDNIDHAKRDWAWDGQNRRVIAVDADTGKLLWRTDAIVVPLTLAADSQHLYFHDGQGAICLDRTNGRRLWASEPIERRENIAPCFGPRLLVWQDVVLFAGGAGSMTAVSAKTGKLLWTAKHPRSGHESPEDLLVIDSLVWSGATANGRDTGVFTGLDPHTGQIKKQFPPDIKTFWFHHRCYPSKATDRYVLTSRTGIEFIDLQSEIWLPHHWIRGGCIYGVMPCNGLIYAPPHPCGCYLEAKLCGFNALAPESATLKRFWQTGENNRIERGPAYEQSPNLTDDTQKLEDWPTYRHDSARSGYTQTSVPSDLKLTWQTELDDPLSSIVIADRKLFVACIDAHTVHALDADSGKRLWSYTAGGRVDSPPTIWKKRLLFGSADGWVYCLRASDGALIWRFRVAPADLRMMAFEQIESVWPVHGSTLIQDGVLYCLAGRSMFLDGGMKLLRLDPYTGRKLSETSLDDRDPETGENLQIHVKGLAMPVALPDVLSSDGHSIFMRSQRFDLNGIRQQVAPLPVEKQIGEGAHLFCQIGFLDDSWFFRSYWIYGRAMSGGWSGWFKAGRLAPSGRIIVFDNDSIYGYARMPEYMVNASVLEYRLYAAEKQPKPESIQHVSKADGRINVKSEKRNANNQDWRLRQGFPTSDLSAVEVRWSQDRPPIYVRAMVLADNTLFIAGPPDMIDEEQIFKDPDAPDLVGELREQAAALDGSKGSMLYAVSASDGRRLARYKLESVPVWDGMAAANGRLYLSMKNGQILCFAQK